MTSPESFKSIPTPENTRQFENSVDRVALVEAAKAKAEGVLMSAPIPSGVQQELLIRIGDVPTDDSEGLQAAFRERDLTPEQQASLWVDRWIRGAVQNARSYMSDTDYEMLQLSLNLLYSEGSDEFNTMIANWRDGGGKPPASKH